MVSSLIFDQIFIVIQNIDNILKINNIDFDINNINNLNNIDNINDMFFDKDIVNIFIMMNLYYFDILGWKN